MLARSLLCLQGKPFKSTRRCAGSAEREVNSVTTHDGNAKPAITGSLAKIKEITSYQKSLYEDLARKIQLIDERLGELNPGVEARVEIPSPDKETDGNGTPALSGFSDYVGFHRGPKGWRLHYVRQHDEQKKIVYHQLLTESRREFQIRAVEYLPGLIQKIAEETERKTDEIRSSLDLADNIADSLV